MKKVINGKRYDTYTATELARTSYISECDQTFHEEQLYLKRTGEYFLCTQVSKLINFENLSDDMINPEKKIFPFTLDEAKDWVKNHVNYKYDELFLFHDDENILVSVLLPETIYRMLKDESALCHETQKDIIINALWAYLDK